MPFTALHLGPALVAKAIFPKTISLRAFVVTQVAIDSEPLFRMFVGIEPLHGPFHSVPGALLVSLLAVLAYRWSAKARGHVLGWRAVADTVLFGALLHVMLDAACHLDMAHIYEWMSPDPAPGMQAVTEFCIYAGIVGLFMLAGRWIAERWRMKPAPE